MVRVKERKRERRTAGYAYPRHRWYVVRHAGHNSYGISARHERHAVRRPHGRRIFAVEMLRLLAIVGIAVFHTFLPAFESMLGYGPNPVDTAVPVSAVSGTAWASWTVGMLKFVGAWGNHVFFMISGFFLVPRMMRDVLDGGGRRVRFRSAARRVLQVFATVVFYTAIMLAVNRFVPVIASGWKQWFLLGLEFVWVYALVIVAAPLLAEPLAHCARACGGALAALAMLAVVLMYAVNEHVAFAAVGSFGLLDWRKWLGALSYGLSFVIAGLIGYAICGTSAARGEASRPVANGASRADGSPVAGKMVETDKVVADETFARRPIWLRRGVWCAATFAVFAALAFAVAFAVSRGDYALLYKLSFKSTSAFSFALALGSLMIAVTGNRAVAADDGTWLPRAVQALASGILGFYVVQSLAGDIWKPLCERAMGVPLARAAAAASPIAQYGWLAAWFSVGIAFSVLFVLVVCVCDRCLRQPLFRALKLSR